MPGVEEQRKMFLGGLSSTATDCMKRVGSFCSIFFIDVLKLTIKNEIDLDCLLFLLFLQVTRS